MRSIVFLSLLPLMLVVTGCPPYGQDIPPLVSAAREGDVGRIGALIQAGADPNLPAGVNGWTPLMHAINKRQLAAQRALIHHTADSNPRVPNAQNTPHMPADYAD